MTWEVLVKSSFLWEMSMDTWGNVLRVLKLCMGEWYWEKKCRRKNTATVCDKKELCLPNTWFYKAEKRKITYSAGKCETN